MLSVMWGSSYLNWTLAAPGEVTRNLSLQEKNPVAGKCSLYRRSRRSSRRKCARQRGSSSVGRSLSVCPQQHVAAAGPWAGQDPAGLDKHIFEAPCPNILKDWGYTHAEQGALFKASFGFRCLRLQTIHKEAELKKQQSSVWWQVLEFMSYQTPDVRPRGMARKIFIEGVSEEVVLLDTSSSRVLVS